MTAGVCWECDHVHAAVAPCIDCSPACWHDAGGLR